VCLVGFLKRKVGIGVYNAANKAPLTSWFFHITSFTFYVVTSLSDVSMNGLHFSEVPTQRSRKNSGKFTINYFIYERYKTNAHDLSSAHYLQAI
jgi:hypothetical protein